MYGMMVVVLCGIWWIEGCEGNVVLLLYFLVMIYVLF